ncbi:MAG: sigma factor G inhibitor Gin [Acidibacillus sp.]|nr:sigma factor G inhibitor Gin [Sulfoacidibacillus ferrooxidans]MCY0894086.1 sigma factor G inhibitor Gin [Acidibacillus sp.]
METNHWVCMMCERDCSDGIHILSQFICTECEQDMCRTEVEDDLYDYFVSRLRSLWGEMMTLDPEQNGST